MRKPIQSHHLAAHLAFSSDYPACPSSQSACRQQYWLTAHSLPLRTAGLSPTRPVEMSPRTHMPLSTASRQSPRKRRWMPKVHSVQSIVDETAEVDVVTEVKNGEPGTNQIQITATEEKAEDTYDRHGVPMEIELQPNSPRHKFRFIPHRNHSK